MTAAGCVERNVKVCVRGGPSRYWPELVETEFKQLAVISRRHFLKIEMKIYPYFLLSH